MKLNSLFTSHMVFAADKPIRVFGEGSGRARVSFAGRSAEVEGIGQTWLVELPAMPAGGPYTMEIELDGAVTLLEDVWVGLVYLFAGQSNMQFKIRESAHAGEKLVADERIRMFVSHRVTDDERYTPADGWIISAEENIPDWSAIGYLTSREIVRDRQVAVGAVGCYQGASVIESWMPEGTLEQRGIVLADEDKYKDHFKEPYDQWNGEGVLYRQTLAPLFPFSFNAVIWYQGESDASEAEGKVYADELAIMIDIWRRQLRDEELPFVIVQIADYIHRNTVGWSLIQKAQSDVVQLRNNVTSVISKDVCEADDIHPPTKDKLSRRIAAVLKKL